MPAFVYLQPLFFQLAQTTLTETALAFYLTVAVWLALRDRWQAAAAILSVGLTARHEAVVFVPIFAAAAVLHRRPLRRLWPILWAPIAVNLLAWSIGMNPPVALFGQPGGTGQYGSGGLYQFFARSLEAYGPAIAALGFAGAGATLARDGGGLVVGCAGVYFLAQVIVRFFGLYDSAGYSRMLVPIGPLWAIMASMAWTRLASRDPHRRMQTAVALALILDGLWLAMELMVRYDLIHVEVPRLWEAQWAVRIAAAGTSAIVAYAWSLHRAARRGGGPSMVPLAALLASFIVFAFVALCGPLKPKQDERTIDAILATLSEGDYRDRPIVSAHIWATYRTGDRLSPRDLRLAARIDAAAAGTLILWDEQFALADAPPVTPEDLQPPRYRRVLTSEARADRPPRFQVFEKQATSTPATD